MSELKTLKDLSYGFNHIPNSHCNPKELRQEAIKHIKDMIDNPASYKGKYTMNDSSALIDDLAVLIHWIKYFLNITEEELK